MGGEGKELGGIEKADHNQAMLCEEKNISQNNLLLFKLKKKMSFSFYC